MGRDLARQPALRAGPRGRGRAAGARRRRARADRVHPPCRGHRAGALRADLPQAPRGRALERRAPRWASSWRRCASAAGSAARAARRRWRWWTPAALCRYPRAAQPLPLLISPAVDERFGATAVLGVPELDRTDELIAQRLHIPSGKGTGGGGGGGSRGGGRPERERLPHSPGEDRSGRVGWRTPSRGRGGRAG